MNTHADKLKRKFNKDLKVLNKDMIKLLEKFNRHNVDLKEFYKIKEVYIDVDYFSIELYNNDMTNWNFIDINTRKLCNELGIGVDKVAVKGLKSTRLINKEVKETYGYDDNSYGVDNTRELLSFAGLNSAQEDYFFIWLFNSYKIKKVYTGNSTLLIKHNDESSVAAISAEELLPKIHEYLKYYYKKEN